MGSKISKNTSKNEQRSYNDSILTLNEPLIEDDIASVSGISFSLQNTMNEVKRDQNILQDEKENIKKNEETTGKRRFKTIENFRNTYLINWTGGKRNGYGTYNCSDGTKFTGEWKDGKAYGQGKFWKANGDILEGNWKDDLMEGYGSEILADGRKYEGEYKEGRKHGKGGVFNLKNVNQGNLGTHTWANGSKYTGEWLENKMAGSGVFIWKDGVRYEGSFVANKKQGYGTYTKANGEKYEGFWFEGNEHGKGKYYFCDGTVRDGMWRNGKMVKWLDGLGDDERPKISLE